MTEALDKGGEILDNIGETAAYLRDFIGSLQGVEGKGSDMAKAITHLKNILGEVQHGSGVLHALVYDKDKAKIV
ncbi:MAG: hypothetical protein GY852_05875, partial [bacterium]|nr:hypothetical protein [bacterium]